MNWPFEYYLYTMRLYKFVAAIAAPIVLAVPAPAPAPFPKPQALTNPKTGLVSGLVNGVVDAGSLSSAIPAVLTDVGDVLTAADAVVSMYILLPINIKNFTDLSQMQLQMELCLALMYQCLSRSCLELSNQQLPQPVFLKL